MKKESEMKSASVGKEGKFLYILWHNQENEGIFGYTYIKGKKQQ